MTWIFHDWFFIFWLSWIQQIYIVLKWILFNLIQFTQIQFNWNLNGNINFVELEKKTIVFNEIWIQLKLHNAISFNIFIQMKVNFHKINSFFHFFTNSLPLVMWSSMEPKFKVHVIFLWFPFAANFCHLAMKKMVFQLVHKVFLGKKCPNFLDFKGLNFFLLGLDDKLLACHQNEARFLKQFTFLYDL
jgi:hypothetical protein